VAKSHRIFLVALNQRVLLSDPEAVATARDALKELCEEVHIYELPWEKSALSRCRLLWQSLLSKLPLEVNWFKYNSLRPLIQKIAQTKAIDVAYFDTLGLAEYLSAMGRQAKVLNHHDIESTKMERRARVERNPIRRIFAWVEGKKLRTYERHNCPKFDVNLAVSEVDRRALLSHCSNLKVEIIPNGVDTHFFAPRGNRADAKTLMFSGTMNYYPNVDALRFFLTRIWPLVKKISSDMRLLIVGKNPRGWIQQLPKRDPRISVTGYVEDTRPYFEQAGIYICPIRDGGGTRVKILDALAMAKPVISTTLGCEGIEVTPGKNILIADTPDQFVQCIEILVKDGGLRERLGVEGRKLVVVKYSWEAIGARLCDLFSKLKKSQNLQSGN